MTAYENGSSCDLFGEPIIAHLDYMDTDSTEYKVAASAKKPSGVSADFLSKIWNIKHDQAKGVLAQTTHLNRQGADNDLSRHFSTNDRMLRNKRINSQFFTDTFFVTAKGESTRGNKSAQIFVSDKGFVAIYLMKSKGNFIDALKLFCKEVGVPMSLVVDPSGEQTSKKVKKFCHQVQTSLRILEESTQWANRAELYVGLFKESIRKDIKQTNCPLRLWDYCAKRRAQIHNLTPRDLFQLNGNNPTTATFGSQGDISNLCRFGWYNWCYFREEGKVQFPFQKNQLGRVLGPCKNEGNMMSQSVLKDNGQVVPRRTIRPLLISEVNSEAEKKKRDTFDDKIFKIHGDSMSIPAHVDKPKPQDWSLDDFIDMNEDEEPIRLLPDDPVDASGKAIYEQPFYDAIIHAEVLLPQGEMMKSAKVKGRSKDSDGNIVGTYDNNPLLNSMLYDVEFPDGAVKQYAANTITQNMYEQVDGEGYSTSKVDSIVDYDKDKDAVLMKDK